MATLQDRIAESFLARLAESTDIEVHRVEQLRALLNADKRPKVDDFVKVFSSSVEDDVK